MLIAKSCLFLSFFCPQSNEITGSLWPIQGPHTIAFYFNNFNKEFDSIRKMRSTINISCKKINHQNHHDSRIHRDGECRLQIQNPDMYFLIQRWNFISCSDPFECFMSLTNGQSRGTTFFCNLVSFFTIWGKVMESHSPLSKMVHFYHSTTYRTKMYPIWSILFTVSLDSLQSHIYFQNSESYCEGF